MIKSLLVLSILIQISTNGTAFNLYKTPNGANVRWDRETVEFVLDPSLAALGSKDEVRNTLQKAVTVWETEGAIPVHFELVYGDCRTVANDETNCIFACTAHATCPKDEKDKGASTFLSVSPETGGIQDVDIVFNAVDWDFGESEDKARTLDLTTVSLHELGHALGIDHSLEQEAAMYPNISVNAEGRSSLHSDDINAAMSLYEGFQPIVEATYGCSVPGPGADVNLSLLVGIAALWVGCVIRRGRRETH